MNKDQNRKLKRLARLAKQNSNRESATLEHLSDIEEAVDDVKSAFEAVSSEVADIREELKKKFDSEFDFEIDPEQIRGEPGKDADAAAVESRVIASVSRKIPTPESVAKLVKVPSAADVARLVPTPTAEEVAALVPVPTVPTAADVAALIPKPKDGSPDSPDDIAEKLNTLREALDFAVLKNVPEFPKPGYAVRSFVQMLDVPQSYTGAGGKVVAVKSDGSGLEFIDGGGDTSGLVPYTGATSDVNLGLNGLTTNDLNISGQTASRLAIFDASKNVVSADTSTYPSLTELSYVKGVTSDIQTQLDAKGAGTVTSVATDATLTGGPVTSAGTLGLNLANANTWTAQQVIAGTTLYDGLKLTGNQSPSLFFYTSLSGPDDRNYSITTTQGINGNFVINQSASAGGDPSNRPVFAINRFGGAGFGTGGENFARPSPLPSDSRVIEIMSNNTGQGVGILARRGGDNATGFNLWEYGGNAYLDNYYDDDSSKLRLRVKAGGTPVVAQTIMGTGDIGVGVDSSIAARLHVVKTAEQLRLGYDASNYYSATVGSTGGVTFDAVGSEASFTFSDDVVVPDLKATTYHVGADAGIDATVTYVDTVLGAQTLTFKKGILTAQA